MAINATSVDNASSYNNGVHTVSARSGEIGGTGDSFNFAYQTMVGDGTIVARITSYQGTGWIPRAGLMLREGPTPTAAHALMSVVGGNTLEFRWRASTGGGTSAVGGAAIGMPYWLKMVRSGNTIAGYASANGVDWTQVASQTFLNLGQTLYGGLAVSSYSTDQITTARFDYVNLSTGPDFYLAVMPLTWTSSSAGDTSSYALGMGTVNGFSGSVNFSVTGLPAGATAIFNPSTVASPGSTTLTISVAPGTPAGSYPFQVHAASASVTHSSAAILAVSAAATGALPAGWTRSAISATAAGNTASYGNGVYTVAAQSGDIAYGSDSFNFAYQPFVGDGMIVARITSYQGTGWIPRAGLMLREGPTPTAAHALMSVVGGSTLEFRWRTSTGGGTGAVSGVTVGMPYWLKLVRSGNTITGYASPNGVDWTQVGSQTFSNLGQTLYGGLAVSSYSTDQITTAKFDQVAVSGTNGSSEPDFAVGLPSEVQSVDVGGSVRVTATIRISGGFSSPVGFSVAGLPPNATANFSPASLTGNGSTTLIINTAPSTPAGVYTLTVTATGGGKSYAGSVTLAVAPREGQLPSAESVTPAAGTGGSQVFVFVVSDAAGAANVDSVEVLVNSTLDGTRACYLHYDQPTNTVYLRDDSNPSWVGSGALGATGTLSNSQCSLNLATSSVTMTGERLTLSLALSFTPSFVGTHSLYLLAESSGVNSGWQPVGAWTVPIPVGSLPSGWTGGAINATATGNAATYADGVYTVSARSGDIAYGSDSFNFAYQTMVGDGTIVARITSYQGTGWIPRAGLMLREGPTPTAAHALMSVVGGNTLEFRWRASTGGGTGAVGGAAIGMPYWLKMVRSGNTIAGYASANGVDWTQVGSQTFLNLGQTLYGGLAVSSYSTDQITTARFDYVNLSTGPDFYLAVMPLTWTSSSAGDTSSYAVGMGTVNGFSGSVSFSVTGLPAGATAIFNPSMVASPGSTTLTVSVAPATPAGSYPFQVHAASASVTHSSAATLAVSAAATGALPAGWTRSAISATAAGNTASYGNGEYTVAAQSGDIAYGSDSFNFAYQTMMGDGTLVARITSYQGTGWIPRAGLMLREGPTPTAAHSLMSVVGGNALEFRWRASTGGGTSGVGGAAIGMPYWLKLVRSGNTITGYASPNGVDWTQVGSQTFLNLGQTLYGGLAVSSYSTDQITTAKFDQVAVSSTNGSSEPDFALGLPSEVQSVDVGGSVRVTATIKVSGGFYSPVGFSVAGLPPNATANFGPASLTGNGSTTLIINTAPSTPAGVYTLTVTATGGGKSYAGSVTLAVAPREGQLPSAESVTPAAGTGANQVFVFVVSDAAGAANIGSVEVLVNSTLDGTRACYLHYDQPTNTAYLRDDSNPSWVGSGALGATGTLSNGQCSLNLATSSVTMTGERLTLSLALSFTPSFVGTQSLYLLAESNGVNSGWQPVGTWTVPIPAGSLPSGWTGGAINATATGNTATYTDGVYTVAAQSGDIAYGSDSFNFAYQTMVGDGTLVARITSYQGTGWIPRAGLMLREGPTPTAAHALMSVVGGNTLEFRWRASTGGGTGAVGGAAIGMPYWLKLVRSGNTITGYASPNGVDWTQVGSQTYPNLGQTLYGGLAVSSYTTSQVTTTRFDSVIVSNSPDFYLTALSLGAPNSAEVSVNGLNGFAGEVGFSVTGLPAGVSASFNPSSVTGTSRSTLTISGAPGTYPFVVSGSSGSLVHGAAATLTLFPDGWTRSAVNATASGNSAGYANGVFTVAAQSGDIWDSSDSFNFVYRTLVGDGTIVARISSIQGTGGYAKAGVMLREGPTPTAINALMCIYSGTTRQFQWRGATNGATTGSSGAAASAPYWVKLVRAGNTITGYASPDGVNWTQSGTQTFTSLGTTLSAGLAVSSYTTNQITTATFDSVSVTVP